MIPFDPEKITFFAKTDARGAYVPFGIKAKDRQRHMYVIGKTGMGKSTLLENMAAQDIMNGEGMAFIDPHGSAAETLLEYVPEHRRDDVVYFAPFDMDHPVAFNVMEDVGADKRHLVVSGLMSTFKKIWVDAWSARMEYILTNALLALIEYPDTTLLSVNRLFADKAYREKVVDYIKDPAVKSYWVDEFASYTDRYIAESVPAIQNKIGQFTGNPLIRNIIGQPKSSFDIRQMMDDKKILIMNLSKGLIGETNANLLGSMLTTRIYLAAMSRADLHPSVMKTMPNFYFYVDEFQSFANSTFANILSEARKYHLNLIIAHQYVDQMEEDVRSAVFGNVGTTVAFRVGPFDAEVLETVFSPQFLAVDLVNLGFAQIYLSLMIDGVGSQPFSAQTLGPLERPAISYRDMVIETSRKNYAARREDVEQIVLDLHAVTPAKEGEGKKAPHKNGAGGGAARNGQSGFKRPAESDGRPFVKKEAPPQKSSEDLRAILGKMSQGEQGVKKEVVVTAQPVVVAEQPQPAVPESTASAPLAKHTPQAKQPEASLHQPVRDNTPQKTQVNLQRENKQLHRQKQQTSPFPAKSLLTKPAPAEKDPKADLKNALASVLQNVSPDTPMPPPVPAQVAPRPAPDTPPRTTPAATETPQYAQSRRPTPQFGAAEKAPLDPHIIRRMLRDERQDKSPFS